MSGILEGPQSRREICDDGFGESIDVTKKEDWISFQDVVIEVLGNEKDKDNKNVVHVLKPLKGKDV